MNSRGYAAEVTVPLSSSNGSSISMRERASNGTAHRGSIGPTRRNLLLAFGCAVLFVATRFYGRLMMLLGPSGPHTMVPSVVSSGDQHPGIASTRCRDDGTGAGGLAESIVRKSFDATYAKLLDTDCTHDKTILAGKCYREILRNHTSTTDVALPWWFRTLLEESAKITSGWWMTLKSRDPPLRQCQLPKVGSKQWSIFMHIMNNDTRRDVDGKNISYSWNERGRNDAGPKFVVLRDPLERYLSAFLDKCVDPRQQWQKHCEPLPVFQGQIGKGWMKEIKADGRVFFDAYVHSSPLKWNMHFFAPGPHV